MAREPMTDEEIARARQQLENLREEVRLDLAEDLEGDPDDYRVDTYLQGPGGEVAPEGGRD